MSHISYIDTKDSGITWLGKVPFHWKMSRLRFCQQANPPKSEVAHLSADEEVSFVPMESVGEYGGLSLEQTKPIDSVRQGYTYFRDNDVVVAKITPCFENGKGAIALNLHNGIGFGTTELHVMRPKENLNARFLFYISISESFRKLGEGEMYGAGGQKRVPEDFVQNYKLPIPALSEQTAIANFLDHETAKIDTLIAKQQRLIELLQEKRQVLISHAVTKGLNPDAPMKDSGVEWLGEIPAHWKIMQLKREISFITSGSRGWAEHYADTGDIFIRIGNLTRNSIQLDLSDIQYVTVPEGPESERTRVKSDDLLISITAYLGSIAVVSSELPPAYINQHIALVRPTNSRALPKWLGYQILSTVGQTQLAQQGYGGTKIQLTLNDIATLTILVPPKHEQQRILEKIEQNINEIDLLIEKATKAQELLKERRSSLISAAVTGKIDVRGYNTTSESSYEPKTQRNHI